MFVLSYFRTLRKIVEEPDIAPGTRGGRWLPRFGASPVTAIVHFIIRTLLRSRQHRLIFSFFLALALTVVILSVKASALAASMITMLFAVVGLRVVFAMPIELRANWIFRVANTRGLPDALRATRRSMLILSVAPVWILWSSPLATGLFGAMLVELCLLDFYKIPFTCSYLPGKANVYYLFFAYTLLFLPLLHAAAGLDRRLLLLVLSVSTILLRLRTASPAELRFEEVEPPAVQILGLQGD